MTQITQMLRSGALGITWAAHLRYLPYPAHLQHLGCAIFVCSTARSAAPLRLTEWKAA